MSISQKWSNRLRATAVVLLGLAFVSLIFLGPFLMQHYTTLSVHEIDGDISTVEKDDGEMLIHLVEGHDIESLHIFDEDGAVVHNTEIRIGQTQTQWNPTGIPLPTGEYTIIAVDGNGDIGARAVVEVSR